MKAILPILAVGSLLTPALATVLTDNLTPEEQALIDKGMTGELYQPTEHSHRFIGTIEGKQTHEQKAESNNPAPVLFFVFGMEDAAPARDEGKTMAEAAILGKWRMNFFSSKVGTNIMTVSSLAPTSKKANKPTKGPIKNSAVYPTSGAHVRQHSASQICSEQKGSANKLSTNPFSELLLHVDGPKAHFSLV